MEQQEDILSWDIPEYRHFKKTGDWFWVLGILAITGITVSILLNNILLAILLFVGALTIALFAIREPQRIKVMLTEKGIRVGKNLHPFTAIHSFYISFDSNQPEILLEVRSALSHQSIIPIRDVSPDDVRLFLAKHITEKEQEIESFAENISRHLGF